MTTAIRPHGPRDAFTLTANPENATRLASALTAAHHFMTSNNLHANSIECSPGPDKEWDPAIPTAFNREGFDPKVDGFTLPGLPRINVRVHFRPDAFHRWCEALGVEQISVERRPGVDTLLHAEIRAHGFTWIVSGDLNRPEKPHPHLPGIPAPWVRENGRLTDWGRISRDDLRTVLTTLGVL
ncbi:hypothetical protein ACIBCR_14945 [Micromonospora echinospora]|uniref:hypothetical protein n=1 Tax=Micromonospora echinospora TaxID=1877 RepID=UPI0037AB0F98